MSSKSKKETIDGYVTYIFLAKLTTPFSKWKAYKLGLIDQNGFMIRAPKTKEEHEAWGYFDRLVRNIKMYLKKTPAIQQGTANFYMACNHLVGGEDPRKIEAILRSYKGQAQSYLANIQEDAIPVNAVGDASSMAGLDNNPPVRKKPKLFKRLKKQLTRK